MLTLMLGSCGPFPVLLFSAPVAALLRSAMRGGGRIRQRLTGLGYFFQEVHTLTDRRRESIGSFVREEITKNMVKFKTTVLLSVEIEYLSACTPVALRPNTIDGR